MRYRFYFCLSLFLLIYISVWPDGVSAQISPKNKEELISDYRYELEQYRDKQRVFELDKAEYAKLRTLVSRDKAVFSTKALLTARATTLKSYVLVLDHILNNTQGVDTKELERVNAFMVSTIEILDKHLSELEPVQDQFVINQVAAKFEQSIETVLAAEYYPLMLISIGRIQSTADQVYIARIDLERNYIQAVPDTESKKALLLRGLVDLDSQISKTNEYINLAWQQYYDTKVKMTSRDRYQNVVTQLQSAYSSISNTLNLMSQIEQQI